MNRYISFNVREVILVSNRQSFYAVVALLVLLVTGVVTGCATREEMQENERQLAEVRSELEEARAGIEEKNQKIQELEDRLEELQAKNKELKEQHQSEVDDLKERIKTLENEKQELQDERERLQTLRSQNEELQEKLSEVQEAKTSIEQDNLVVTLDSKILFDLGSADLKESSRETLDKVAEAFAEYEDRPVAVEGHTDTIPIRTERFPSNWHLSAARAVSVIEYLTENHDIAPKRFIAAGFGEHHPVVPNTSAENREQNRRVEIVLYPPGISEEYQDPGRQ